MVEVAKVQVDFYQPPDSGQPGEDGQTLTIWTEDAGGGPYICIKTDRWSMDNAELGMVQELAQKVLRIHEKKETP